MEAYRKSDSLASLYSHRNGVGLEAGIRELFTPPEHKLSPQDTEELIEYSYELLEGQTDNAKCEVSEGLEAIYRTPAATAEQTFYLRYFLTPQGRADLQDLGITELRSFAKGKDQLSSIQEVASAAPKKTRQEIAVRSLKWYKAELAERLLQRPRTDEFYVDEESVTVNYEPEKLLKKLEGLQAYRRFFAAQSRELHGQDASPLQAAKLDLLSIYKGRLNNIVAKMYSRAFNLAKQLYDQGGSQELKDQLRAIVPILSQLFENEHRSVRERDRLIEEFARRLDLVRNGADWEQTPQGFINTPVSREVRHLLTEPKEKANEERSEPLLPATIIEKLKQVTWDATQVKAFNEAVLGKWGMLSACTATWEEVKERSGRAPDNLFQVVITPEKDSLSINSNKYVMYIPQSFNRGLVDMSPAGALPVSAHELEHCVQALFDEKAGQRVAIARIKGRRYETMREAGGVYNETDLLKRYFAITRKTNLHYLRALEAKLQGGNRMQTIRAFYESLRAETQNITSTQDARMRATAVDRSLRLYRNSGYNSQPLDYVEQALIVSVLQDLSETRVNTFLTAAGSFNLSDTVILHRLGLVEVPQTVDIAVVDDVMRVFLEQFADKYLA